MIENSNKTIGKIVASNLNIANIFEKYGIDYCCNGNLTLKTACIKFNVDQSIIEKEIEERCDDISTLSIDINKMTLNELINHIVDTHHIYLKDIIPKLKGHIRKIVDVHGIRHAELHKISELFLQLEKDIMEHLDKEENILYPYIKDLILYSEKNSPKPHARFISVKTQIQELEKEHEVVGGIADQIHKITADYTIPDDACNTYRLTLKELKELEHDLHIHILKENQILHPKAIEMERKLGLNQ